MLQSAVSKFKTVEECRLMWEKDFFAPRVPSGPLCVGWFERRTLLLWLTWLCFCCWTYLTIFANLHICQHLTNKVLFMWHSYLHYFWKTVMDFWNINKNLCTVFAMQAQTQARTIEYYGCSGRVYSASAHSMNHLVMIYFCNFGNLA